MSTGTKENSIDQIRNDHIQQHSNSAPASTNEIGVDADLTNDSSVKQQSWCTIIHQWFNNLYQRLKSRDNQINQTDEELTHPNNETDQIEIKNSKNKRENLAIRELAMKVHRRNFFPLSRAYRSIRIKDKSSVSIACDGEHILLKQKPNLCILDKQLNIVKESTWAYDHVDFCWSSSLSKFILITPKHVFTLDKNSMIIRDCDISLIDHADWSSGSCSNISLYLSTVGISTNLYEYSLQPTMQFIKEWRLYGLYSGYEGIINFTCTNDKIALIISNIHAFQRRIEIRLAATLERVWSSPLDTIAHCCSINNDQWMVMELLKPRLLHFSSDGKILQEYKVKTSPSNIIWNALQLDNDTIATLTMDSLNVHKLLKWSS